VEISVVEPDPVAFGPAELLDEEFSGRRDGFRQYVFATEKCAVRTRVDADLLESGSRNVPGVRFRIPFRSDGHFVADAAVLITVILKRGTSPLRCWKQWEDGFADQGIRGVMGGSSPKGKSLSLVVACGAGFCYCTALTVGTRLGVLSAAAQREVSPHRLINATMPESYKDLEVRILEACEDLDHQDNPSVASTAREFEVPEQRLQMR